MASEGGELIFVLHFNTLQPPLITSLLCASDLLTHHFSLYRVLERKSQGRTYYQLCVYVSTCMCV